MKLTKNETTLPLDDPANIKYKPIPKTVVSNTTPKSTLKDVVMALLIVEQPRLTKYPHLLNIFLDILMFRLETKKSKVCALKATVNQINVGINITEEILNEHGLGDDTIQ
jgi:hypothetical protein